MRPTKVDRASDVTGLVDTGELGTMFGTDPVAAQNAVSVLESMAVLSDRKLGRVDTKVAARDADIKKFAKCGYVKSAYLAERFSSPAALNPVARRANRRATAASSRRPSTTAIASSRRPRPS